MGLRTVRDDAGPISFHHAFVRALIAIVEIYAFSRRAGVLLRAAELAREAAGRLRRRDVRRARAGPAPAGAPRRDAAAAGGLGRGADMASLPTGLALAVRQFLGRLPQIDPASRATIGGRLAAQVAAYVAPPPPPGTPPEAFLAAVVASRRERDAARLAREADLRRRLTARR